MTRVLYISERKAIELVVRHDLGIECVLDEPVVSEHYSDAPDSQPDTVFNGDFNLGFPLEYADGVELESAVCSTLPYVLGCDFCVTVDMLTKRPMMVELLNIVGFGPDSYGGCFECVRRLLTGVGRALDETAERSRMGKGWSANAGYLRLMYVHGAVCFHAIRRGHARGEWVDPELLNEGSKFELAVYRSGGAAIGLDGWLDAEAYGGALREGW